MRDVSVVYAVLIPVRRTRMQFAWCESWNYTKVSTWSACTVTAIPQQSVIEYSPLHPSMSADSKFYMIHCRTVLVVGKKTSHCQ